MTKNEIPDWAKIKAHREGYPTARCSDDSILKSWPYATDVWKALARRTAKTDTPPVSQETLIGREAFARYYDKWRYPDISKEYREGFRDIYVTEALVLGEAIKLALEGFGKEGAS